MSPTILNHIVQIADALEHRGIVICPLFPRLDLIAPYITLDEAIARGLRVRGVDEAGSVPELAVENPLDARVLLYDGEELVGAKQNRILNVSVLIEAKATLTIPVSRASSGDAGRGAASTSLPARTSPSVSFGGARRRRRLRARSPAASGSRRCGLPSTSRRR